jgi:uncharacterized protein YaaN involved in tellurite resistance
MIDLQKDHNYQELDKHNKKRFNRFHKSISSELKNIPCKKYKVIDTERDDIICYNLALMLTWGDIR